ncbi:MAG: hypothetical protein AAF488_12085, partial [Planctomycetota bacterium]
LLKIYLDQRKDKDANRFANEHARVLLEKGFPDEAQRVAKTLSRVTGSDLAAGGIFAAISAQSGDQNAAIETYLRISKEYEDQGNRREAVEILCQALEMCPGDDRILDRLEVLKPAAAAKYRTEAQPKSEKKRKHVSQRPSTALVATLLIVIVIAGLHTTDLLPIGESHASESAEKDDEKTNGRQLIEGVLQQTGAVGPAVGQTVEAGGVSFPDGGRTGIDPRETFAGLEGSLPQPGSPSAPNPLATSSASSYGTGSSASSGNTYSGNSTPAGGGSSNSNGGETSSAGSSASLGSVTSGRGTHAGGRNQAELVENEGSERPRSVRVESRERDWGVLDTPRSSRGDRAANTGSRSSNSRHGNGQLALRTRGRDGSYPRTRSRTSRSGTVVDSEPVEASEIPMTLPLFKHQIPSDWSPGAGGATEIPNEVREKIFTQFETRNVRIHLVKRDLLFAYARSKPLVGIVPQTGFSLFRIAANPGHNWSIGHRGSRVCRWKPNTRALYFNAHNRQQKKLLWPTPKGTEALAIDPEHVAVRVGSVTTVRTLRGDIVQSGALPHWNEGYFVDGNLVLIRPRRDAEGPRGVWVIHLNAWIAVWSCTDSDGHFSVR